MIGSSTPVCISGDAIPNAIGESLTELNQEPVCGTTASLTASTPESSTSVVRIRSKSKPLGGTHDFLYWSKERFGLTPFITVTHVAIAQVETGAYVVASRDVYSSRYVDASLSFTIASDAVGIGNAFYMVYVNRSRAYALKGPMAGLRRSIAELDTRSVTPTAKLVPTKSTASKLAAAASTRFHW